MKKVLLTLSLMLVTAGVMAVPAKKGQWKTITLVDGTEVKALLKGDEFGHCWMGTDGQCYAKIKGTDTYQVIDAQVGMKKAQNRRAQANAKRAKRLPRVNTGRRAAAYTGVKRGIIILVNFADLSFDDAHTNALYQKIANGKDFHEGKFKGSMSEYFLAQSGGQFELDFDVVGPVTVSKQSSYYGENDEDDNDMYPGEMVVEAVNLVKDQVSDWSQYDWDHDGEVDQVYVIYAGQGEADGGGDDTIWPHAYWLSSASTYGDGTGAVEVARNLVVDTYACGPELDGSGQGQVAGIGTMCHEFSHCLGYPDFYDIDYSGGQGMCEWDLMDAGSYNGDSYQPAGYTGYERWVAGWSEPIVLEDDDVEVKNMASLQSGGDYYIIYNKGNRNEYFMLENRQQDGWDASLPGVGLLLLHVDYDQSVWDNNAPNDDPKHQRFTWVPANKKYSSYMYQGQKVFYAEANDVFPYGQNNSFNKNFDTKLAKLYNKNSNGTNYLDSSVEDIARNNDGTMSFNFVAKKFENTGDTPSVEGALFYESFDGCEGTGGNDDAWSGSVANGEFNPDNDGWVSEKAYGANQCAKFGTSSKNGSATTPAFAVNGTATLTFKAGAWNSTKDGTTLQLTVSNGTISPATVEMEYGSFTDFEATITATGDVKVTFAAKKGRFFLDEVMVMAPNATTAIRTVETANQKKTGIYTLDGRYVGTDYQLLNRGVYIVNGCKVLVK